MRTTLLGILRSALLAGGSALLGGCVTMTGSADSKVESEGGGEAGGKTKHVDRDACKIEEGDIGQEGLVLRLGPKSVTFHDWVPKTGEANEYVGFSLTLTGTDAIGYIVKSGGEREHSTSLTWLHANGPDGGPASPGISNVDFCEECEDGSCDDGGDGCIEGCDEGGGGGGGGGGGNGGGGGGDGGDGGDGCIEGCDDGGDGVILL